ncbi:septum formation inhibitor Maf [Parageobacillus sp. VR-IP]|uniref:Maf family protein n=1 Tax=Parageobacillus sp. VR-IP TaxID=2742205 RepID=UPI001583BBFB|nr:Maf family protein [Parageobacillus sp. VR-IP]NUK30771.1 septum formation inhibitor Maf [Parageobacillus sp. VR-IP]
MKQLILASSSPRRKQLLELANIPFQILASRIEEYVHEGEAPEQTVQSLAYRKAKAIATQHPNAYVIGADTIVVYQNNILGKPKTKEEAAQMLRMLSGQEHEVLTGVAILSPRGQALFVEKTKVFFWDLTEEEIAAYVESGEPMDKAGAYGIQGRAALFVKRIEGDYFTVVGLPLSRTVRELKQLGW